MGLIDLMPYALDRSLAGNQATCDWIDRKRMSLINDNHKDDFPIYKMMNVFETNRL